MFLGHGTHICGGSRSTEYFDTTMRLLVACATLHVAISFTPHSQPYGTELPRWHRGHRSSLSSNCDNHHSRCSQHRSRLFPSVNKTPAYGGRKRSRGGFVRRSVGENDNQGGDDSANLDDSDDNPVDDSEIYASLRARLVELETKAALEQVEKKQVEASSGSMGNGPRSRKVAAKPPRSPEERRRSIALLTIQSVGVISVALLFGTAVLYWLAGDYFVHLGPRIYPGASPRSKGGVERPSLERSVDDGRQEEENDASGLRRGFGDRSATRDPFHFEGFPDVSRNSPSGVK